jgi:NodT family efflux transporter outer membrane factor (OMF) lipoprotein
VLVAACAVGPDFEKPAPPAVTGYSPEPLPAETAAAPIPGGEAQRFVQGMDIPGQWWQLYHSPPLNTLIDEALRHNPDLKAAQAALKGALEEVYAQEGAFFPTVAGSFSPSRQKTATGALSPASASGNPYFSLYTGQLSVSYMPDVFGLNRRTVESLRALADVQHYQLEATYLTLTSNVVAAAVQEASLRGQIAATEDIIKIEEELLALLHRQFALGAVAEADVVAQEAALGQSQAALPPLRKQLAVQRNLLTALVGRFPSEEPSERFELASIALPTDLPVSLPARLVEQRPDVQAANANLHSASALIGVAVANRLPNLTLSATYGSAANTVDRLFTTGTGFWSIAATLSQPILDGGTLLHKERAARAAYDQAAWQYRSAVITGMQNVADSLRALENDADALEASARSEHSASESLAITRKQLELGAINYLSLLNAQQTYLQARITLVQAQTARYADTAALFQALGGGWWNRSDVAKDTDAGDALVDRFKGP